MASRTQLRLGQITGSFGNVEGGIIDTREAAASGDIGNIELSSGSMVGVLSEFASAMLRIHGHDNFANNGFSTLKDIDGDTRITYVQGTKTQIVGEGSGADSIDIDSAAGGIAIDVGGVFSADAVGTSNLTTNGALTISGSTGLNLASHGGEIDITATQGNIDINATTGVIDIDATGNITIDSVADVLIQGNDGVSVGDDTEALAYDGSGNVDFDAVALDIDASGAITIDGTSTFSIDGVGASNVTTNGELTISGSTGLNIKADSGTLDIENRLGGVDIDAGAASAFNTSAGKITIAGAGGEDIGTSGQTTTIKGVFNVDEAASFDSTVTITGDLTVLGSATEISSSNTIIKDALIVLNSSSYGDGTPIEQDAGIIFAQPDVSRALFVDTSETGDPFRFVTTYTSGSATSVTRLGDADVTMGGITATSLTLGSTLTDNRVVIVGTGGVLEDDGNFTFDGTTLNVGANVFAVTASNGQTMVGKLLIDNDANTLDVVSSDLTVVAGQDFVVDAARDIILDAEGNDITFKTNGTVFGAITHGADVLTLSGGNGDAMVLDANSGEVHFDQGGTRYATLLKDGGGFELAANQSGDNSVKIGANGAGNADLFSGGGNGALVRFGMGGEHILNMTASAGSVQLRAGDGGDDSKDIIFTNENFSAEIFRVDTSAHTLAMPQQNTAGDNAVGLLSFNGTTDVNEAVYGDGDYLYLRSNGKALRLPNANGTVGQVLKISAVSGDENQLEFGDATGDLSRLAAKVTSTIAADSTIKFRSDDLTSGISILKGSTLNITKADGDLDKALEVFVNGQLLMSGSADGADTDYTFINSGSIRFEFSLELDDIVQIIQR